MGMRPLAISWPPPRPTADANGAAQEFSQTSTPAAGTGVHGGSEVYDILLGEEFGELF